MLIFLQTIECKYKVNVTQLQQTKSIFNSFSHLHKELEFHKQIRYFIRNVLKSRVSLLCCVYKQQESEVSNEM
jgi:hypothetical protein